ncbi:MAG: fused MFS/spermidine synthase [Planctomycetota bacterium]
MAINRKKLQAAALFIFAFWSGGSLMALELAGAKLLDGVYGSTIFVFGSIISLFMVSLAFGYYFGGRFADRLPSYKLLAGIGAIAGILTAIVPSVADALFRSLPDDKFGLRAGPLIVGAILFALPTIFYGMVSPFAVRISARGLAGLGNVAGRLYAVSTFGSIAGTLLTSFILVIYLPKSTVIAGLGIAMTIVSVIAFIVFRATGGLADDPDAVDISQPVDTTATDAKEAGKTPTFGALYVLVAFAGAAMMAIQMGGARILESEYGSTMYLWGAVIGLFMGGMSLGYYIGGRVSDKFPSFRLLAMLIGLGGAFVAFIPFLADWYLSGIKDVNGKDPFGFVYGPLVGSLVLFFVPCVLLGIIAPFAVKLRTREVKDVGRVAGRMYSLNTVGSIVGTLVVTFVLVEALGKSTLLIAAGLATIAVGMGCFIWYERERKEPLGQFGRLTIGVFAAYSLGVIAIASAWDFGPKRTRYEGYRVIWHKDSPYHEISVQDRLMFQPFSDNNSYILLRPEHFERYLKFNRHWESGINPWREGRLITSNGATYFHYDVANAVQYTDLFFLGLLYDPAPEEWVSSTINGKPIEPKRVMFIGGGGGIGPEQFLTAFPNCIIEVAEIDPMVVDACRRYFGASEDGERITYHVGDGRMILEQSNHQYDMIMLDAFSSGGRIPGHLATAEFLTLCKDKLKKDDNGKTVGRLVSNLITGNRIDPKGKRPNATRILSSHMKTIREFKLFDTVQPFVKIIDRAYNEEQMAHDRVVTRKENASTYDPYTPDNVMVVCFENRPGQPLSRSDLLAACDRLTTFKLGGSPIVKLMTEIFAGHINNRISGDDLKALPDLPGAEVLTDNYTPTDVMVYPAE